MTPRELEQLQAGQVGAPAAGFAQIFPGWNVWDVWQSQDQIEGLGGAILNAGLSLPQQLRIWVEDQIRNHAPGAAVADDANIFDLKGSQIEIVANPAGLEMLQTRADIPELAGALQLGKEGSQAKKYTVAFFNRGSETGMTWPHDENYVLDAVYQPSGTNPLTSRGAPSSAAGAATEIGKDVATGLKVVAVVGGVAIAAILLVNVLNSRKVAA